MIKIENYKTDFIGFKLIIPCFEIHNNGLTLISGENGSGKTTLVRSILRVNTFYEGKIFINKVKNSLLSRKDIASIISYLPQQDNVIYSIKVVDFIKQAFYVKKSQYFEKVIDLLGLENFLDRDYTFLSGGEKQLVKIARSFVPDVEYTILDEPDTFLSKKNKERLAGLIDFFSSKRGIILVSHSKNDFGEIKTLLEMDDFLRWG